MNREMALVIGIVGTAFAAAIVIDIIKYRWRDITTIMVVAIVILGGLGATYYWSRSFPSKTSKTGINEGPGLQVTELGWREIVGEPKYDENTGLWYVIFGINPDEGAENKANQRVVYMNIAPGVRYDDTSRERRQGKEYVWVLEVRVDDAITASNPPVYFTRRNNQLPDSARH